MKKSGTQMNTLKKVLQYTKRYDILLTILRIASPRDPAPEAMMLRESLFFACKLRLCVLNCFHQILELRRKFYGNRNKRQGRNGC